MILFPNAKINIGLNIIKKRPDNYHELETVMVPIPLYDILEILPNQHFTWKQSGLLIDGNEANNLCVRAYKLLENHYKIPPVAMHLRKQIPMGAGLGGGSADAAFVIRGLNELFDLQIPFSKQEELASELGSDCAFFIKDQAQLATGRGEILQEITQNIKGLYLLLVKPAIHINTAQAYSGVHISGDVGSLLTDFQKPIENWKSTIKNDFEKHIFQLHPALQKIKDDLYASDAIYASMSGSGSTMFGLFSSTPNTQLFANYTHFSLKL